MERRTRRRGVAAIEFTTWVSLAVILFTGMVDCAYWLNQYLSVQQAARSGARVGAMTLEPFPATGTQIVAAAKTAASNSLSNSGLACPIGCTVDAKWVDVSGWKWVQVDVTYPTKSLTGLISSFNGYAHARFVVMTQEQ